MWVEYSDSLLENDYTYSLAGTLNITQVEAGGYIALLVAFALKVGDDTGQVDHLTDKAIEKACYWTGKRGDLVKAFCASGVFRGDRDDDNNPLTITPDVWNALAGRALKQRLEWRKRQQNRRGKGKQ